jgi:SAM-dependent methyltransferase
VERTFRTPFAGTSRIRFSGCVLSLDEEAPRWPKATIGLMTDAPRYDGHAEYYEDFRGELGDDELEALGRLLGPGPGRCLDIGCGTGAPTAAVARLGWSVVGVDVSSDLLAVARGRGLDVVEASARDLPFDDDSFDAVLSVWTHTDIDDFPGAVVEALRVLRPDAPLVYIGAHPCFVGPHSLLVAPGRPPELHPGYRPARRYDGSAPGIGNPQGLRGRVGAKHLPLHDLFGAFTGAGLRIERFEELGDLDYPHLIGLRARS